MSCSHFLGAPEVARLEPGLEEEGIVIRPVRDVPRRHVLHAGCAPRTLELAHVTITVD